MGTEPESHTAPTPEPQSSGVQGAQASPQAGAVTVMPASDWKAQESLSNSIRNLDDGRRIAAGAFLSVTSAGVRMLEDELTAARADRQAADLRERETLERYYTEKERASIVNAKAAAAGENSRLRSIMQNVGSILIGGAITLYLTPCSQPNGVSNSAIFINGSALAPVLGIVGIVLLLATLLGRRSKTPIQ